MPSHLRVYRAPDEHEPLLDGHTAMAELEELEPSVRVRLGDLLPLVSMAQKLNFIWLKDFLDDEVSITEDLHQVLQSFRGCRPSAS
jgi:hypothetical protein